MYVHTGLLLCRSLTDIAFVSASSPTTCPFCTFFTLQSWLASLFPYSTELWHPSLSTFLPFAEILFMAIVKVWPMLSALWNLAHPPPRCRINLSYLSHHIIIIWLHFNWIIRKTALCILGNVNERRKNEERNYRLFSSLKKKATYICIAFW